MAKSTKTKAIKRGLTHKTKTKIYDVSMTTFAIVVMGGAMLWMARNIYVDAQASFGELNKYQNSLPALGDSIAHQKVCMASNIYLGDKQMEVPAEEKKYYACSDHCVHQLAIDSIRHAIDPVSHREVDKAMSIVTLHPDKTGKVIYFESNETFNRYRRALSSTLK